MEFADLWRRTASCWIKLVASLLLVGGIYALRAPVFGPEEAFFWRHDVPALACVGVFLVLLRCSASGRWTPPRLSPLLMVALLAALCGLVGLVGGKLVFEGYSLSLDEFMANFDAAIFARSNLLAAIPAEWRGYAPALQPIYMLQTPGGASWASSYLPVNALMRAAADLSIGRAWLNPALAAISVVAIYGVARRIWPDRPTLAVIAAVLLATSSQVMITAMTSYAMTAHLALNLIWLWLFLRPGRSGPVLALAVGFLASGLHQLIFHPLFVAPFIAQLWWDRRWRLAVFYTAGYGVISLFWISYWSLMLSWAGLPEQAQSAVGGGWFLARAAEMVGKLDPSSLGLMAENLVRFVAWQHPLAVPLALIGALAAFRAEPLMRALALGVILTALAVWLLVPSQSHGWGYRYLHGLIGSVCLLAAAAWARMTGAMSAEDVQRSERFLAASTIVAVAVILPWHAIQAHAFSQSYKRAYEAVTGRDADVVLVDDASVGFDMGAIVRNHPYLVQRPKIMLLNALDGPQLRALCSRYKVSVFDGSDPAARGILKFPHPLAGGGHPAPRLPRPPWVRGLGVHGPPEHGDLQPVGEEGRQ